MIDVHVHYINEENYLEKLLAECRRLSYSGICFSGTGEVHRQHGNDAVEEAFRQYPDFIRGFGTLRLDKDGPDCVRELRRRGFQGLKTIDPSESYDSYKYFPAYEEAAGLGLPILFHTGIKARRTPEIPSVSYAQNMMPVHLDRIARAFPRLNLIMAHMGPPWYEEAFMVLRINPNIYGELSSGSGWRIKGMDGAYFRQKLWWPGAWQKLVYASDVHYRRLSWALEEYQVLLDQAQVDAATRELIFRGNMERMLGRGK